MIKKVFVGVKPTFFYLPLTYSEVHYGRRTGQDRTGQDRTGQDRTGQDARLVSCVKRKTIYPSTFFTFV